MTNPTFYIESGTGKQIGDVSQLNPNMTYVQSGTGSQGLGSSFMQPIAQTPPTPQPQIQTPSAPQATAPQATPAPAMATPKQGALTMPASGSIVDLLNMAGQDSSYTNRAKMAQQYGIQGYQGSAAQNIELSKKFLEGYNAMKSTPVPDTRAQAASAMDSYFKENAPETQEDPEKTFFDQYMTMNPVMKTIYDTLTTELSRTNTSISFADEYKKLLATEGIPGLQTELMNVNRIMEGTEDDIRDEITMAGGFATESQVQAMKGARNKTLLKQANSLTQQLALKQDYVDQIMQFSKLDRDQVEKDIDRRLGLTEKLASLQEKMTEAAKENYQTIVNIGEKRGLNGYAYLAESLGGDPRALRLAEGSLGLPKGALSNAGFLMSTKEEWSAPYKLGGSYVQKNSKTGEIRTAASIPNASGLSGPTSYQEWVLAGSPGTYADYLKESNVKAPTVAQQTVATYAARVEQANPTISRLQETIKSMSPAQFEMQRALPSYFQTADYQEFDQAARNFINATLRRESGAVISPSEFDNAYKQYLPRSGDSQATLLQKQTNRDIIYASFKKAAGNAYQSVDELLNVLPTKPSDTYEIVYNGKTYTVDAAGNMTEKK